MMKKLFLLVLMVGLMATGLAFAGPAHAVDITVQWDANTEPDLKEYQVFKAEMITGTQTGPLEFVATVLKGTTTYTIVGLDANKVYVFQVYAIDTQGNTSFGSNFCFNLDRMAPGPVQNLRQ